MHQVSRSIPLPFRFSPNWHFNCVPPLKNFPLWEKQNCRLVLFSYFLVYSFSLLRLKLHRHTDFLYFFFPSLASCRVVCGRASSISHNKRPGLFRHVLSFSKEHLNNIVTYICILYLPKLCRLCSIPDRFFWYLISNALMPARLA